LVLSYGLAWIGHFFIEKNRPATFRYPIWSFLGDLRMYSLMWRGKMAAEVQRLGMAASSGVLFDRTLTGPPLGPPPSLGRVRKPSCPTRKRPPSRGISENVFARNFTLCLARDMEGKWRIASEMWNVSGPRAVPAV
jgi:2-hydroxy-palmitic acid dioxygenase Mpo1-like protein